MTREQMKEYLKLFLPIAISVIFYNVTASQFVEWMSTTMGIAFFVPIVVEHLKAQFGFEGKEWKFIITAKAARWVTWGLCLISIALSHYIGWGFQSMALLPLFGNVLIAGFFANGYYKYEWVQKALAIITDNLDKLKELIEKAKEEKAKQEE